MISPLFRSVEIYTMSDTESETDRIVYVILSNVKGLNTQSMKYPSLMFLTFPF